MIETFVFPNKVRFGVGAVAELPDELALLDCERVMLVTDPGLISCGLAQRVKALLEDTGVHVALFDGVDANPTEENVEAGVDLYCERACEALIGLGGGSPLDVAKAIRLKVNHFLPLADYAIGVQGWERMDGPMPPMIAVPTTAGTGSEVARGALIIVRPSGAKVAIVGPELFPSVTVCDPELTLGLPPALTAGTGMDALTHCVEEYISPKFNPLVAGMALEGIRRCSQSLLRAYEDGSDIDARSDMMIAAMIGGIGFAKGLGVVHSLSHPVGSIVGGHHGTTNAIFLPAALEFNRDAAKHDFPQLCEAVGLGTMTGEEAASAFIDYIRGLNERLNMPEDLSVFGAKKEHVDTLLPMCMADHCHKTNPRVCTEQDFRVLLDAHIPD